MGKISLSLMLFIVFPLGVFCECGMTTWTRF